MKQITLSDRIVIEAGICTGKSIKKISEDIGKNPSTVSREIRTNRSYIRGSFYLLILTTIVNMRGIVHENTFVLTNTANAFV